MIRIGDFRIITIDDKQMSYEQYKETKIKGTNESRWTWVRVGGYFGKLEYLLKDLKEYILRELVDTEREQSVNEIIAEIDKFNNAFVDWKLEAKDENV